MIMISMLILVIIAIYIAIGVLRKRNNQKALFVVQMIVNALVIIFLPVIGLIFVLIFEWKHIKRWRNSGRVRDFIYDR